MENYFFTLVMIITASIINIILSGWVSLKIAGFIYEKIQKL